MNQKAINLDILGLKVAFRPGTDMERVKDVVRFLEQRFADQKLKAQEGQTKDILLTFLALGLADELLQSRNELAVVHDRIAAMLTKLEGVPIDPRDISLGRA